MIPAPAYLDSISKKEDVCAYALHNPSNGGLIAIPDTANNFVRIVIVPDSFDRLVGSAQVAWETRISAAMVAKWAHINDNASKVGLKRSTSRKKALQEPASASGDAEAAKSAGAAAKCRDNLQCWSQQNKNLADAEVDCSHAIDERADTKVKWLDGFWSGNPTFDRAAWIDKSAGTVEYVGDEVLIQNGYGAMVRMIYTCDYDPIHEKVLRLKLVPGNLN